MKVIDLHPPPASTESHRRKCSLFTKKFIICTKKGISSPKFKFQIIHTSKSSFFRGLTWREGISARGLPVVQETGTLLKRITSEIWY
jgi:hypothetical protein